MIHQLPKWTWVALATLLALPLVVLWSLSSPSAAVCVTFQQTTNDPANGQVGIIKVVNTRDETVDVMGGWYVPAERGDLSVSKDTPIASIYGDMPKLSARSTNSVQVSLPTNRGPYKLVLQCMPARRAPWRVEGSLRYRVIWSVSPWLHPSQRTLVRWFGGCFAASQSIDVSQ